MTTASMYDLILSLGYLFKKTQTECPEWQIIDIDGVPLMSSSFKGELVWKFMKEIGEV